jgi:hypothetical protein
MINEYMCNGFPVIAVYLSQNGFGLASHTSAITSHTICPLQLLQHFNPKKASLAFHLCEQDR